MQANSYVLQDWFQPRWAYSEYQDATKYLPMTSELSTQSKAQ
jgi:hypothetical protein